MVHLVLMQLRNKRHPRYSIYPSPSLPPSLPPSLSFSLIPHPLHTHSTLIHSSLNSLTKQPAAKPKEKVNFTVSILDGKVYKSTDANGLSDPWVRICKSMWRGREGKGREGKGREGKGGEGRGGEERRGGEGDG